MTHVDIHVDIYGDPDRMFPQTVGGTVVKAGDGEITIEGKDGRIWEISPDAFGRVVLRINEVQTAATKREEYKDLGK